MTFCFLDIETTGLDPRQDEILEIAWRFTDSQFVPLDDGVSYLIEPDWSPTWHRLNNNPFVKNMHTANGLLADLANPDSKVVTLDEVWFDLRDELIPLSHSGLIHLAGRSVHFDKSFLLEHEFTTLFDDTQRVSFHHKLMDFSSVKLLLDARGFDYKQFEEGEVSHRALNDVNADIEFAQKLLEAAL